MLFTIIGPSGGAQDSRVVVERIGSGQRRLLVDHATYGHYTASGHILYATEGGAVFALPYDVTRQSVTGSPVGIVDGLTVGVWGGGALFAVSRQGTLAYVLGSANAFHVIRLVDPTGRTIRQVGPARNLRGPMFSPDGSRIAVTWREPGKNDVWLLNSERGDADDSPSRPLRTKCRVWSPDGKRIAYRLAKSGGSHLLMVRDVVARAESQLIRTWARHVHMTSWSSDGKWLAAYDYHPINNEDVWALAAEGKDSVQVAASPARELNAVFSPDSKWLAYQSDESGKFEVYVVSFPSLSVKRQVSPNGGIVPRWDRSGTTLHFLENGRLVSAGISTRDGFAMRGAPTPLFATTAFDYDVAPDGKSFLLALPNRTFPLRPFGSW